MKKKTDSQSPAQPPLRRLRRRLIEYEVQITQASRVMALFGGARGLKRAFEAAGIKKAASSIYRWNYPREKGGCGGHVPTAAWPLIFSAARLEGILITPEDLDPRVVKETRRPVKALVDAEGNEHKFTPGREKRAKKWEERSKRHQRDKAKAERARKKSLKEGALKIEKAEARKKRDDDIFR
jgi:hypothetical protein